MKKHLEKWLADGKITQAEFDAAIAASPQNPKAWDDLNAAHAAEVATLTQERDNALAREAAKDKIISTFSTRGNPAAQPDADPLNEVVKYINKKRGFNNGN